MPGRAVPVASHPSKDQKMASAAQPTSAQHSAMTKLPLQTSSVAKSLFRPLPPPAHSSPYTPQQSNPIQDQPAAYPSANSSVVCRCKRSCPTRNWFLPMLYSFFQDSHRQSSKGARTMLLRGVTM